MKNMTTILRSHLNLTFIHPPLSSTVFIVFQFSQFVSFIKIIQNLFEITLASSHITRQWSYMVITVVLVILFDLFATFDVVNLIFCLRCFRNRLQVSPLITNAIFLLVLICIFLLISNLRREVLVFNRRMWYLKYIIVTRKITDYFKSFNQPSFYNRLLKHYLCHNL